jgi:hypothetical protein
MYTASIQMATNLRKTGTRTLDHRVQSRKNEASTTEETPTKEAAAKVAAEDEGEA